MRLRERELRETAFLVSTEILIMIIAAVAGASAVFGFAFCRAVGARALRRAEDGYERIGSILATVPGGFVSWDEDGEAHVSEGLRQTLDFDPNADGAGLAAILARFGETDAQQLSALVEGLNTRGEEFSRTLLTIDAGQAIRIDGRRARDSAIDVLWMSDVTNETAVQSDTAIQLTAAEVERDSYRAMLDALPLMVWRRGTDLSLAQVNRAYVDAIQPGADDDGTRRPSELEDVEVLADPALARRARSSGLAQSESRHVVIGGSRRLMEFNEVPSEDNGVVGYALDFTHLEEVQEELSSHVAAQSDVLENLAVAVAIYGSDTRLKFYNSAYARLWDADPVWLDTEPTLGDELEKLRERRLVTEQVDFRAHKQEQIALFTSLIAPTETLVHLPDGKTLFKRVSPHPLGGLMFTYEDVTDRLSLEARYNTMIEVQRRTLDNLYEGVSLIGPDGRLKLCNSAYGRLWQFSEADLAGEPRMADLVNKSRHFYPVDDEDWEEQRAEVLSRLMSREPVSGTYERADGSVLQYAGVPLPDGMMLMTYFDVTDSDRVERALRERNEALEEADRLKSGFVANVSYELRTPLNTIIGFAEVMHGNMFGPLNERQAEYVAGILEASEALLELINDILDLATIEAGYMTLDRVEFDIHSMMSGVFTLNRERARGKEQKLVLDCAPDIGSMFADERRLKQVLFNLVSNAIKFTPEQGVITLGAVRDEGDILFRVEDTGVGIHEEEQERVLEKFERGNRPRGCQSGVGAGLGLSLVKSFVELHGGDVHLTSEPDTGAAIVCRMPAAPRSRRPDDREDDIEAAS